MREEEGKGLGVEKRSLDVESSLKRVELTLSLRRSLASEIR